MDERAPGEKRKHDSTTSDQPNSKHHRTTTTSSTPSSSHSNNHNHHSSHNHSRSRSPDSNNASSHHHHHQQPQQSQHQHHHHHSSSDANTELALQRALAENDCLKQKQSHCDEVLVFVNRSWSQLTQELHTIAARLGKQDETTMQGMLPHTLKSAAKDESMPNLLRAMLRADSTEKSLPPLWQQRAEEMRGILSDVVTTLLDQRTTIDSVRALAIATDNNNSNSSDILEDYKRLREESEKQNHLLNTLHTRFFEMAKRLELTSDQLQLALAQNSAEPSSSGAATSNNDASSGTQQQQQQVKTEEEKDNDINNNNNSNNSNNYVKKEEEFAVLMEAKDQEIKELEAQVEKFRKQLATVSQTNARAMFQTSSNLESKAANSNSGNVCSRCSGSLSNPNSTPNNTNNNANNNTNNNADTTKNHTATIQALELKLAETEAVCTHRAEEIENIRRELTQLREQHTRHLHMVHQITEPVIRNSPAYRILDEQARKLTEEMAFRPLDHKKFQDMFAKQKADSMEEQRRMKSDQEAKIKELVKTLHTRDTALSKCKQQIEALQYKYEVKKQSALLAEERYVDLRKTVATQQTEIVKLREERRLAGRTGPVMTSAVAIAVVGPSSAKDGNSDDNDQQGGSSAPDSSSPNKLAEELSQLRQKQGQWEKRENEMKTLLEVFQSRAKDSRDDVELRLSEKKLQESLSKVNAELDALKLRYGTSDDTSQDNSLARDLDKAVQAKEIAETQARNTEQQLTAVLTELEEVAKAYEDVQEQNIRLINQLNEKDDTNAKLINDHLKAKQMHMLLREEQETIKSKLTNLQKINTSQNEAMALLQSHSSMLQDRLDKWEIELTHSTGQLMEARKMWRDAEAIKQEVQIKERQNHLELEENKKIHLSLVEQINELQKRAARAEENAAAVSARATHKEKQQKESQSQLHSSSSSDLMTSLLEEERKELKTKVLCPVCTTRERNIAISKCGHVFCRHCIQINLAKRNRKCPACGLTYGGESDLCSVYL